MKKLSGFTLLELAISCNFINFDDALFMSLNQLNRSKKNLDNVIRKSDRVALVHYITEHDLMGTFVPVIPEIPEPPKEEKKENKTW